MQLALYAGSCLPATPSPRHLKSLSFTRSGLSAVAGRSCWSRGVQHPRFLTFEANAGGQCRRRAGPERAAVEGCGRRLQVRPAPAGKAAAWPGLAPRGRPRVQAGGDARLQELGRGQALPEAWPPPLSPGRASLASLLGVRAAAAWLSRSRGSRPAVQVRGPGRESRLGDQARCLGGSGSLEVQLSRASRPRLGFLQVALREPRWTTD